MITMEWLLEQAVSAEKIMDAHKRPPGTIQSDEYMQARRAMDGALTAARWLEEMGLTQREQVGPFGSLPIAKGQKVRIKRGTVIRTTHPRYDHNNPKIAKRDYTVTVHDVYQGTINTHWHSHQVEWAARDQEIVWPGEGGYWCYVPTHEVEIL